MTPNPNCSWNEILAAYADGELEGRDDLAVLKERVEDWLAQHPEAEAELEQLRQLKQAWQDTTPSPPAPHVWQRLLRELEQPLRPAPATTRSAWRRSAAMATALAACVALALALWSAHRPDAVPSPQPALSADEAPFAVAAAHEVEILDVDGADTHTLVVGELPVQGPLVLAAPGEITVTSVQPAARDNMVPEVNLQGPGRPMIWARAETD
jgi:anti-sigma factor RsiW